MQVIIQPVISLFDELSYRLLGWRRFDKWERLDVELHTTHDLVWIFANWQWILAYTYLAPKGMM